MEAESIRSRAESTRRCVKLKTVTEIRQSSAGDTFISESVYSVLSFLWDWEPVERLKQGSDVVRFRFLKCEASSTRRLWTEEAGRPERREQQ